METSSLDCVICHDKFTDAHETGCCHQCYCKGCIEEWIRRNGSCPSCRSPLPLRKIAKNIPIQRLVDEMPIPCTYADKGCKAKVTRGTLAAHLEQSCQPSDVLAFARFCIHFGRQFAPPTIDSVCAYIEWLANMEKETYKVKTIKRYLTSIQAFFKSAKIADPTANSVKVKMALKTAKITQTYKKNAKQPLTPQHLIRIRAKLDWSSSRDRTFWAAVTIGYWTLLRGTNLVPKSLAKFTKDQHLCAQNLAVYSAEDFGTFALKKTKTTQFDQPSLVIPIVPSRTYLCPFNALIEMWKLCPLGDHDPLFMYMDKNGQRCPLLLAEFKRMLKEVSARAGIKSEISLASIRQGGMDVAEAAGVAKFAREAQGDCYLGAYHNYIDFSLDQRLTVARAVASWTKQRYGTQNQ